MSDVSPAAPDPSSPLFRAPTELAAPLEALIRDHEIVEREYRALGGACSMPWPGPEPYEGRWDVVSLVRDGSPSPAAFRCPATMAAARAVPGVVSLYFSLLGARSRIPPNRAGRRGLARAHLGLIVPPGCWFAIQGIRRPWKRGEVLAFETDVVVEAVNPSDEDRLVLVVDWPIGEVVPGRAEAPRA